MTATDTQLQQLYIAYFGRAADPSGLTYWSDEGTTTKAFAAHMHAQAEFKDVYGDLSVEQQVNQIYNNLFDRDADATGLLYWTNQINSGTLALASIANDLIWAAENASGTTDDKTCLSNKTSAAIAYTNKVKESTSAILAYQPAVSTAGSYEAGANITEGRTYLATINKDTEHSASGIATSVSTIESNGTQEGKKSFTLTTGIDNFTGGSGADTFDAGTALSLGNGDVIDGKGGTDTITAKFSQTTSTIGTKNIEKYNITATGATTLNLATSTGITTITNQGSSADLTLNNLAALPTSVVINTNDDNTTINLANSALSSSTDDLAITLQGTTSAAEIFVTYAAGSSNNLETVSLVSESVANIVKNIDTNGADVTTLEITGAQDLTITDILDDEITTVSAGSFTGDLKVTTGAVAVTTTTGSGDDTVVASTGNDVIVTGAGADTITLGTGVDNVSGGAGIDTFIDTSAGLTSVDTIAGGAGTDVLSFSNAPTVVDSDFTNITAVETITNTATNGAQIITLGSLADAAGVATITGSGTGVDTVTVGAGFDNALLVNLGTGDDDIDASASAGAMTFASAAASIDASDTLRGGTGSSDVFKVTADSDGTGLVFGASATGIETITVVADTTNTVKITTVDGNVTDTTGSLTVDGSALTNTAAVMTFISAEDSTATINVTGGAGADALTMGVEKSNYSGGGGADTFTVTTAGLTSADTIAGGDGTDVISTSNAATYVDSDFTNVTTVETLTNAATNGNNIVTLGSLADAAGIATITGVGTGVDTVTVGAGFDNALLVTLNTGNDDITASASAAAVTFAAAAASIDANDTLLGGTGSSDVFKVTADSDSTGLVFGTSVTGVETITVVASTTHDVKITTVNEQATASQSLTVDASGLTNTGALLVFISGETGSGESQATVNVTGGAGIDTITAGTEYSNFTGGTGADTFIFATANLTSMDTITAGDGTDVLTISNASTLIDSDFKNVTSVDTINNGTTNAAQIITLGSLADAAGIATITGNGTGVDTVTVGAGFNNDLAIALGTGADDIDASASSSALSVTSTAAGITAADTLKGGTGTGDTITLTALTAGTAVFGTAFTGFETIAVTAATTNKLNVTTGDALGSGETITLDAAGMTNATAALNFDGSAEVSGTGTFNINGSSGNDTIKGGFGIDTLDGGTDGADVFYSYNGNDAVDFGETTSDIDIWFMSGAESSTNTDTITNFEAGIGKDIMNLTALGAFNNTTVEALHVLTTFNDAGSANDNLLVLNTGHYHADAASLLSTMGEGASTIASGIHATAASKAVVAYQASSGGNYRIATATVATSGGFTATADIAILSGVTAATALHATNFVLD